LKHNYHLRTKIQTMPKAKTPAKRPRAAAKSGPTKSVRQSPKIRPLHVALLVVALIILGLVAFFTRASSSIPVPSKGIYWGFSVYRAQPDGIAAFESMMGRKGAYYHWYKGFNDAIPTQDIKDSQA